MPLAGPTDSILILGMSALRSGPYDNFPVGGVNVTEGNSQPTNDRHHLLWFAPIGRVPAMFGRREARE